jgi:hypothetical protein
LLRDAVALQPLLDEVDQRYALVAFERTEV